MSEVRQIAVAMTTRNTSRMTASPPIAGVVGANKGKRRI